jgi:xylulokinase
VLSLAPYVVGRLCGLRAEQAFTDPTHMSGFILGWDATTRDWSDRQLAALGVPRELLPRVVPPETVVGGLTQAAAQRLGLPAGTPMAAGAGDVPQSNLSAGLVRPGRPPTSRARRASSPWVWTQ